MSVISMSIIDWSDPDEMLGLLAEYIQDECLEEHGDHERAVFLRELSRCVKSLASHATSPTHTVLAQLRDIYNAQPGEFLRDPALIHLQDCIEELSRIVEQSAR